MTDNQLQPVEQKTVSFYDDELTAIRADDDNIYVSVRQMCNALGLDAQGQRRRMQRHTVLEQGLKGVDNLSTPGGIQSGYVLRVDLIPLWVSGIRAKSVVESVRPKIELFQTKAAHVLWKAFQHGELTDQQPAPSTPASQAVEMAKAILQLAQSQLRHEQQLADHSRRLEAVEATLSNPDRLVTAEQAQRISEAVKSLAFEMSKRSGRNEHQAIYGELYRRYGIPSYRELPAAKFDDCQGWLGGWYERLTDGGEMPF